MKSKKSSFVVVDGPSGSGKDTLLKLLDIRMHRSGRNSRIISEETLDRERFRILKVKRTGGDVQMAEVLVSHRAPIYVKFVYPVLKMGTYILANRGEPATLAYQTVRWELTMQDVWDMHRSAGIAVPDLVIITTCRPSTSIYREEEDRKSAGKMRKKLENGMGLSGKVTEEEGAVAREQFRRRRNIHTQYKKAVKFLRKRGVKVVVINTEKLSISEGVTKALEAILG
jgi:thymidylate kinase